MDIKRLVLPDPAGPIIVYSFPLSICKLMLDTVSQIISALVFKGLKSLGDGKPSKSIENALP